MSTNANSEDVKTEAPVVPPNALGNRGVQRPATRPPVSTANNRSEAPQAAATRSGANQAAQSTIDDKGFAETAAVIRRSLRDDNPMARRMNMRELENYAVDVTSHSATIMNHLERLAMLSLLEGMNCPNAAILDVCIDIAYCCKDLSSSSQAVLIGKSPHCDLKRAEIVGCAREVSTLRRFCAYYAKDVWNLMIMRNDPPSDYAAKGFKYSERFAAFDFFYGVLNSGAHTPDGGLVREPSQQEILANEVMKDVKLRRAKIERGIKASNLAEVNGGDMGKIKENPF